MEETKYEDTALTQLVRAGDSRAVAELYRRHHTSVLAFARRLCPDPHTAEDLASEAFARTLRTVRTGEAGPVGAWRPYLYAVVRNTAAEWARTEQRRVLTAEFREDELTVAGPEPPDDLVERAYRSLPPRWQTVLWHTVIEDERPEQVADLLGTTPGNVGVLAFRAREGLRKAYLAAHVEGSSPGCRRYAEPLATAVRKKGRLPRTLRTHLESCPNCARAHSRLLDLNSTLRAALPLALLPLAADGLGRVAVTKTAAAGMLKWAIPATAAATATAAIVFFVPPDQPRPPLAAATPTAASASPRMPEPTLEPTASSTSRSAKPRSTPTPTATPRPTASVAVPRPTPSPTPTRTPKKTRQPAPTAVAGTRINHAGQCVGEAGGQVAALSCTDPRTAWSTNGDQNQFQLVNVVTGRCLTAGDKYDTESFNGGGIRSVQLAPCSAADVQLWKRPGFSDGVPRLVNVPTGMSLSIGKEFGGKHPPTAFILYGAYTSSEDQRITFAD